MMIRSMRSVYRRIHMATLEASVTTSADHLVTEEEPRTHAAPSPCIAVVRSRLAPNDLAESCFRLYGEACIDCVVDRLSVRAFTRRRRRPVERTSDCVSGTKVKH
jgi:hypothetical protein